MLTCLLLLTSPFQQGVLLDKQAELRAALRLPASAALQCEWVGRWYALDEADYRRSLEHCNRVAWACWKPESEEEEQVLALKRERTNGSTPGCLRSLMGSDWEHRKSERLLLLGDGWNSCTNELSDKGVPTCTTRLHASRGSAMELVEWAFVDGARTRTVRHPMPDDQAFSVGAKYLHEMWSGQVTVLLELAAEQSAFSLDGETLRFDVDIRSMADAARFERFETLNAAFQYPGLVAGAFRKDSAGATLDLEWRDCADALLETNRLTWNEGGGFPSRLEQRVFAPGTELLMEELVVSVVPLPDDPSALASLAWQPEEGERIQDMRFLYSVDYAAGVGGELPDDAWVASEAEALSARIGELRPSQIVSAETTPGPGPAPAERSSRSLVLAGAVGASMLLAFLLRSRRAEGLS